MIGSIVLWEIGYFCCQVVRANMQICLYSARASFINNFQFLISNLISGNIDVARASQNGAVGNRFAFPINTEKLDVSPTHPKNGV